jgi:hypothetical protein
MFLLNMSQVFLLIAGVSVAHFYRGRESRLIGRQTPGEAARAARHDSLARGWLISSYRLNHTRLIQ